MSDVEWKYEYPSFNFDDHLLNKAREDGEEVDLRDSAEEKGFHLLKHCVYLQEYNM